MKDKKKKAQYDSKYRKENWTKILEGQKKRRNEWATYMKQVKENTPCMDCDVQYPSYVMDFDHRDPSEKLLKVSSVTMFTSFEKLKQEMEKCDIVCANCHRVRTFKRGQYQYNMQNVR